VRRYAAAKPPDRQWLNPTRFLDEDRFRDTPAEYARTSSFSPREAAASVPPDQFLVKPGTPEWDAWKDHNLKTSGKDLPMSDKTGGWYVPRRWPPSLPERAAE
jgi:hypothetical protein